jgi:hypothetical protein
MSFQELKNIGCNKEIEENHFQYIPSESQLGLSVGILFRCLLWIYELSNLRLLCGLDLVVPMESVEHFTTINLIARQ